MVTWWTGLHFTGAVFVAATGGGGTGAGAAAASGGTSAAGAAVGAVRPTTLIDTLPW